MKHRVYLDESLVRMKNWADRVRVGHVPVINKNAVRDQMISIIKMCDSWASKKRRNRRQQAEHERLNVDMIWSFNPNEGEIPFMHSLHLIIIIVKRANKTATPKNRENDISVL